MGLLKLIRLSGTVSLIDAMLTVFPHLTCPKSLTFDKLFVFPLYFVSNLLFPTLYFQDILDEMRKELSKLKEELIDGN